MFIDLIRCLNQCLEAYLNFPWTPVSPAVRKVDMSGLGGCTFYKIGYLVSTSVCTRYTCSHTTAFFFFKEEIVTCVLFPLLYILHEVKEGNTWNLILENLSPVSPTFSLILRLVASLGFPCTLSFPHTVLLFILHKQNSRA